MNTIRHDTIRLNWRDYISLSHIIMIHLMHSLCLSCACTQKRVCETLPKIQPRVCVCVSCPPSSTKKDLFRCRCYRVALQVTIPPPPTLPLTDGTICMCGYRQIGFGLSLLNSNWTAARSGAWQLVPRHGRAGECGGRGRGGFASQSRHQQQSAIVARACDEDYIPQNESAWCCRGKV